MTTVNFESLKPRLLIVDDDESHCWALQGAFERRGYAVKSANSAPQALTLMNDWRADYAVVDLRMPGPSGLTLIPQLRATAEAMRIVVLTGYASIATAVEAIKLGAIYYLTKPVDADAVEAAFARVGSDECLAARDRSLSADHLAWEHIAWEHIRGVLATQRGNVSAAARVLGMDRRTLQRKLNKHPIRL
jgi:two-component system response regulator RegA